MIGSTWRRLERIARRIERLGRDPRHYQIAVLSLLVFYGAGFLGFPIGAVEVAVLVGTALATQALCGWIAGMPFDPRSPLISGLSLSLLLRSDELWVLGLGAALAIASKFAFRLRGKHVFNPANFGLIVAVLVTGQAWTSPGQWGSAAFLGLLMACAGGLVVYRAARSDVTYAFVGCYAALLFGRASWLGDPWTIPLRTLESGALLLFAFFMISDPKTTPNTRAGRILFGCLVAVAGAAIQFLLHRPNGFLWALFLSAPLVPGIDRILPGRRYRWRDRPAGGSPLATTPRKDLDMNLPAPALSFVASRIANSPRARSGLVALGAALALLAVLLLSPPPARGFCGFYVAKADSRLFNRASQVVLVRDGDRTVLTMANDFKGDPREFALVVPVPTFLERDQIHVAEQVLIDHLDAFTSPRLVEYFDEDPCLVRRELAMRAMASTNAEIPATPKADRLGVTIEAKYTVGEYDILILSAEESRGLETWLRQEGYRIPDGATAVLGSYLKQGMRFFVAKVNLDQQQALGYANLRPLQIAFESPKFMLPIRLGTVNADGPQELFVYTLTRKGRVETTNYRTIELPTGNELPGFVKAEFADFYRDLFARQVERDRMQSVYLEYAWDMGWCDPCAADPLSRDQVRALGAFWVEPGGGPPEAFVTRLHLRYDRDRFPDDLRFQETANRVNFQGRYVLRHPWQGEPKCAEARRYLDELPFRLEREAQSLASLTGWDIVDIRRKMGVDGKSAPIAEKWWQRLWPGR